MSVSPPLDWIRQIEESLLELEEKPQFGGLETFDWNSLAESLCKLFNSSELKIEPKVQGWVLPEQLPHDNLHPLVIHWSPLHEQAYFVTSDQDLKLLMAELLGGKKSASYFFDTPLARGFYHYLGVQVLQALEEISFAPSLSPRLSEGSASLQEMVGEQSCYVIDLSVKFKHKTVWGEILLTDAFRREWKSHFAQRAVPFLNEERLEKTPVEVGLEVGQTALSYRAWQSVRTGDFILLDRCTYDPVDKMGSAVLTLGTKPLFRGKIKKEGVMLSAYPTYEEVDVTIDDDEEGNLYGDLDSDSDLDDEDSFFDDEEEGEALESEAPPPLQPESGEKPSLKPEELPVQLTVEVGRLRMNIKELMNLAPGNLLELPISPEQGVDIRVNGKKMGRGELIRMGETLGVRIISL